ncbi:MAG TPA: methylated-DNA--[protein]-cysteine S-methyltransferase [Draconibacterium sp.]|nr:methylated-DNA--[protein]-cysteine S-methyltransferase [Draconibacterium sp.]HRX12974.1 methylated-DNA--[protein]-cysteine S-methyltransferase [Draconibacterium sp.]
MENIFKTTIETPVGYLELTSDQHFLLSVSFAENNGMMTDIQPDILKESVQQITEFFEGTRKEFDLKLKPAGTDFQLKVWEEVKKVPFGKTVSYLDIAIKTGSKNNTRAVGLANGKNPIPIIIPCHRIIGTNGKLTGYAGGLERKKWLLQHESQFSEREGFLF